MKGANNTIDATSGGGSSFAGYALASSRQASNDRKPIMMDKGRIVSSPHHPQLLYDPRVAAKRAFIESS